MTLYHLQTLSIGKRFDGYISFSGRSTTVGTGYDLGDRTFSGVGLQVLDCKIVGFNPVEGMDVRLLYVCFLFVCAGSCLCEERITPSEESYCVCVCVCDLET
jgi:hypothetical protein